MDFENFDINLFYNLTSNKKKEYIKKYNKWLLEKYAEELENDNAKES